MFDLIAIGDTVIDTIIPLEDARVELLEGGQRMLALPYGRKVPVGAGVSMVAGNAANNAVGSSRLKLKTAIYTNVGNKDDDQDDDRIKAKFKREGVDIRYVVETASLPSNHNIVLSFEGERTILTYHQPWKFYLPDLDKSQWIYLTSMSPSYTDSNILEQLVNYIERVGAKLAFQPGTFQLKQGAKKQSRILSLTDFFVLNLEEAKHFLGHETADSIPVKKILLKLSELGPKRVVVTDGHEGSHGFDGENYFKMPTFPAKLVEMTGAGDAFATATLAGLFYGHSLPEAMRWGAANSASVVEQIGSQAGLLSLNKMKEVLEENKEIVAMQI